MAVFLFILPLLVFSPKNQCYYNNGKIQPNSTPYGDNSMGVWRVKNPHTHSKVIFSVLLFFCDSSQILTVITVQYTL